MKKNRPITPFLLPYSKLTINLMVTTLRHCFLLKINILFLNLIAVLQRGTIQTDKQVLTI
jgi:hypothetical protein